MKKIAKIIIEDEVNCSIQGLDLNARRDCSNAVKYFLPHARYSAAYKLGRWDGKQGFCSIGGRTYLNVLDKLLPILERHNYEFEIEDHRAQYELSFDQIDETYFSNINWPSGHRFEGQPIVLRDYQVEAINDCLSNLQGISIAPTSAGKCQPLSSKIKTPTGWTTMGNIAVGDHVTVPDGSIAKVLAVYDPGVKDIYRIEFEDGRVAKSCTDHLWRVYNDQTDNTSELLSLGEIIKLSTDNNRVFSLKLATLTKDDYLSYLPIDPYLFGAMIGKNAVDIDQITKPTQCKKSIPAEYLNSGYIQRLSIVQGLIDSAGYLDETNLLVELESLELANSAAELVRSIGGIATVHGRAGRTVIEVRHQNPRELFKHSSLLDQLSDYSTITADRLRIKSIELDSKEAVRCIMIDHPDHLYLTDSFIVTHNTLITAGLSSIAQKYGRTIVIVPNKNLVQQTEEDYRNIGLDVGVLYGDRKEYDRTHTICTWQSLNVLDKKNKDALDDDQLAVFLNGLVAIICDECFDGNMRVLTTTGYVPIKNIKPGDSVINVCEKTKEFKVDTVVKQHKNLAVSSNNKMYQLEFDNGVKIMVTGNHKFMTNLGWCRADELTPDHEILNYKT